MPKFLQLKFTPSLEETHMLEEMRIIRAATHRAERIEAAARLLAVVLICLIAYSCAAVQHG